MVFSIFGGRQVIFQKIFSNFAFWIKFLDITESGSSKNCVLSCDNNCLEFNKKFIYKKKKGNYYLKLIY